MPVRQGRRLIPTHAGKTVTTRQLASPTRAHPRSRGENDAPPNVSMVAVGSSPLTRGKPSSSRTGSGRCGLIPAHAGKTFYVRTHTYTMGSSPLTRGKLILKAVRKQLAGLIPAHAGKTDFLALRKCAVMAHPRSRGENGQPPTTARPIYGSSPLTRGKLKLLVCRKIRVGLIPAHAGKTYPYARTQLRKRAHPRSRGENRVGCVLHFWFVGSSPLTRGKR